MLCLRIINCPIRIGGGVADLEAVGHGLVLISVGDFDFDGHSASRRKRQTKISCIARLLFRGVYRIDRKLGRVVGNGGLSLRDPTQCDQQR